MGFPAPRHFALLAFLALASCATDYQPQHLSGGFSDYMTASDEAVITFRGNEYTSPERVIMMLFLRSADVTLEHGYRYFIGISMIDLSTNSPLNFPADANTPDTVFKYGNYTAANPGTDTAPAQTLKIYRPAISIRIRMANDVNALEPLGGVIDGQQAHAQDANVLSRSLRQALGIATAAAS
jgi:hypothetical protein